MSAWWKKDAVKDLFRFLEYYKKNSIKIVLSQRKILRRIQRLYSGVVLKKWE
jgi:hypothetical protein